MSLARLTRGRDHGRGRGRGDDRQERPWRG